MAVYSAVVDMNKKMEDPESLFLRKLFKEFEEYEVRYAVMRNYDMLPRSLAGSDLDLLVEPDQEKLVRCCINRTLSQAGGVSIGCVNTVGLFKIFAFGRGASASDDWWGIRMDVSVGMSYAGSANLLHDNVFEAHIRNHNGIKVLSSDLASLIGVVKELLYNDVLAERYLDDASEAIEKRWASVELVLSPMGEKALESLKKVCLEKLSDLEVLVESKKMRKSVKSKAYLRSPIKYTTLKTQYYVSRLLRFINPPGKLIAVLGTDGSGKSTLINAIRPVLERATHGDFVVEHLRPGLLPPLSRLKGEEVSDEVVVDPHGNKPSGFMISLARVFYYMLDYVFGYWVKVRPRIAKNPTIFLFDRYAYDLMIDSRRFRIKLPFGLLRLLIFFMPRPDLVICLHGDPEILAARKKELPLPEVKRQVKLLRKFSKMQKSSILISTESTINEARDEMLMSIKEIC